MKIELEPVQVTLAFLYTVLVLTLLNGITMALYFYLVDYDFYVVSDYFDFGVEGNIPTFYSAFAILVCSGLLAVITKARWHVPGGKGGYWLGLAIMFLVLALDEAAEIHEWASNIMDTYMTGEGYLYYLWVLPYSVIVLVIGLIYLRFVFSLPRQTRNLFIIAGVTFIAGAIGFEMISANAVEELGEDSVVYTVLYTIEELLEMLGIVIFLHALLRYITEELGGLELTLSLPGGD